MILHPIILRPTMNLLKMFRLTAPLASFRPHSRVGSPRVFPTTGFKNIPMTEKVEEECLDWYTPQSFYPVRIGDVIHSKYQVLYKIGYGTTSTLWICRDLYSNEYVCMKSMVCDYPSVEREIKAYEVLSEAAKTSTIIGHHFVRQALDHFELESEDRNYHFLIHEPLGVTVELFASACNDILPIPYVQTLARHTLNALEFIHSAQIVHGDLQPKNILLRIHDKSVIKDGEEGEIEHPSNRKITEQTAVFETRDYVGPLRRWIGNSLPVLCDFGEARMGQKSYTELIQPALFRAPEVFLHIPWGTSVDIWSFGCMVWSLMFHSCLFSRRNSSGKQTDEQTADKNQLAWMVALLGPPPRQLLENSGSPVLEFFHEDGSPKGEIVNETLESLLASSLKGIGQTMTAEESEMFLAFIRKTVTWTQETRASASELLHDPWIQQSLPRPRS